MSPFYLKDRFDLDKLRVGSFVVDVSLEWLYSFRMSWLPDEI